MSKTASFKPIRKAVFPVAGLGTRFLPATKSIPKEMLPVVDKPILQYAVEEAKKAGIEHFVFVTGRGKTVIEDHFDIAYELEQTLEQRQKTDVLDRLRSDLPEAGQISYTRQQSPLGLGHAVWCARDIIGNEPFALLLPDMLMKSDTPCLKNMMDLYAEKGGNIISVEECAPEDASKYGIVQFETESDGAMKITDMVEKPAPGTAPSNFFINGRYILQPEVFDLLGEKKRGAGNEIQITDAMLRLIKDQEFHAVTFTGQTFDCGSRLGFLQANLAYSLDDSDLRPQIQKMLENLNDENQPQKRHAAAS